MVMCTINDNAQETFDLGKGTKMVQQLYDEDWSEWCDIAVEQTQHMGKIHVIVQQPSQGIKQDTHSLVQVCLFSILFALFGLHFLLSL